MSLFGNFNFVAQQCSGPTEASVSYVRVNWLSFPLGFPPGPTLDGTNDNLFYDAYTVAPDGQGTFTLTETGAGVSSGFPLASSAGYDTAVVVFDPILDDMPAGYTPGAGDVPDYAPAYIDYYVQLDASGGATITQTATVTASSQDTGTPPMSVTATNVGSDLWRIRVADIENLWVNGLGVSTDLVSAANGIGLAGLQRFYDIRVTFLVDGTPTFDFDFGFRTTFFGM